MLAKVFSCAVIGLPAMTAGLSMEVRWWLGVVLGLLLAIICREPIGLFIRG